MVWCETHEQELRNVNSLKISLTNMEKLLMQQCRYHEMRERLMDAMVQERLHEKITQMETINSEHRQCYAGQIYRVHQHSRGDLQRQR